MVINGKSTLIPTARYAILILLTFSLISSSIASAQPSQVPISIVVAQDRVTIDLALQLRENFTSLPVFKSFLDSSNSTIITTPMQVAMQKLVPGARIDSLTLHAGTSLVSASSGTWLFSENYTIIVDGVNRNLGSVVRSNLGFIAMNASGSILLGGVEINSLGSKYLVTPLKSLTPTSSAAFFLDGAGYSNSNVPGNVTATFNILDFSWVSPVSQWNNQPDPLGSSTVWTLNPRINPYNLTVGLRQIENIYFPVYQALYVPTLRVSAPARSWADGTNVLFDLQTPTDIAMPLIIGASLVILVAAVFLDRRLRFKAVRKKRR